MDATVPALLYDLNGKLCLIKLNSSRGREMKKILVFVLFAVLLVTLAACAPGTPPPKVEISKPNTVIQFTPPGPNPELDKAPKDGVVAGLFTGLWHGIISPVTLIVSFFNPEIQMYDVFNTGPLYNLGFFIGIAIVFLILGFSGGRGRSRRR
jgi:hypothetical protein